VLVHAWQASQAGGAAWLLSFLVPSVPLLLTIQEGKELARQNPLIRLFRRAIVRRADAVTAISEYLASFVRERTSMPVHVVPNGVAYRRFLERPVIEKITQAHTAMRVQPRHRVVISVSRLVSKNGIDDLIRAFALLCGQDVHPDELVLVLIGEGSQEGALRARVASLGITDQVRFLGTVPHGDLPSFLHAAHVFCRPSHSEGLGNAFLEAMAAGIPVVATPVGGITDFLQDGKTGFLCRPGDPVDIARALASALRGDDQVRHITDQAHELVRERYDWDTIATQMDEIYKKYGR
jgi:glycosyltransferase involved in cell wall biosynthesis